MARAQLLAWERLGQDIIFPDSDNYYLAEGFGCRTYIPEDNFPSLAQPALERFEQAFDLEVPDPHRHGRMPVILEAIERIHARVGEEVTIRVPGTGPFAVAAYLVGVERFLTELAQIQRGIDDTHREALEWMLGPYHRSVDPFWAGRDRGRRSPRSMWRLFGFGQRDLPGNVPQLGAAPAPAGLPPGKRLGR